jgi:hypothetical protein
MRDNDKSRVAREAPRRAGSNSRRRVGTTLILTTIVAGALALPAVADPSVPCRPDFCWQPPPPEGPICLIEPWFCGSPEDR